MAITTKFTVKRSGVTGTPSNLASGELAYSYLPADSNNGGDRLYIGTGVNNDSGYAANIDIIGGKYYTDLLGGDSDIRGTLTPSSAILVDENSKIDQLKIDSIIIDSSAINTISGNLKLSPGVDGKVVVTSDIIPSRNGLSLGDSTSPFGDLWLGGSTLYIGNLKLSDSNGALVVTNRRTGDDAKLDLGSTTTDSIDEGLLNLYYTTDRVNTDVTALVDSAYVQSRQAGINNLLDSADVIGIIDSAHVQARQTPQDFAYASLTGKPNILDSTDVLGLVTANSTDSATVIGIVDSAYVQSRQTPQDFAYTSLTDVPDLFDSADATALIDTTYVRAKQDYAYSSLTGAPTNLSSFVNDTNYLDSTTGQVVARNAVSATSSGDGSLTYNTSTGVFTYTGPSASNVRAYIQAGTGVTYDTNTGTISIGQDVGTNDNVTFNNITVQGNLQVDGTTTTVNTTSLEVSDNMIYLNAGESSGSPTQFVDVGWAANVNDTGSYEHVGFFRDATDGKFKLFEGYTPEPDASAQIDLSHGSFSLAPLEVLTIAGKYLGFDSDFAAKTTTDLTEGDNLYYTTARHDSDTLAQVDSDYVQSRQDYSWSSITGKPDFFDSNDAQLLIDSAYVQARQAPQDFSYTSLTDVPDLFDSSDAIILIDSAYVQARSPAVQPQDFSWSSLTGVPDFFDSADAQLLIDSAYIQARQLNFDQLLDSAEVIQLIDSAYVQARQTPQDFSWASLTGVPDFVDSADVQTIIDSSYVAARSAPTLTVNQVDSADSVEVTVSNISTINFDNYTGFNVTDQGSGAVKVSLGSGFKTIQVDGQDDIIAVGEDTLEVEAGNGITITTNVASNPKALNISADSSFVTNIVDSSYVQLRSPTYVGFDSDFGTKTTDDLTEGSTNLYYTTARHDSDTRALVDSAYIQARQADIFRDSGFVTGIIDSAYIQARQVDIFRDSGFISSIIDSAYIQLRDRVRDSSFVTSIIDSAYISLRDRLRDSTFVEDIIDSAYIQARQITYTGFDSDFGAKNTDDLVEGNTNLYYTTARHDSDTRLLVDSAYVQARQADIYRDSGFVTGIIDSAYIEQLRPAETIFSVAGNGSDYIFTGDGFPTSANDPTLYLTRGKTYKFKDISGGHPLEIRQSAGGAAYNSGVTNNGGSGTIEFTVPMDAPNSLVYQCIFHAGMLGDIVILNDNSFLDSSTAIALIDSAYIQNRQSNVLSGAANFAGTITYNLANTADSSAYVLTPGSAVTDAKYIGDVYDSANGTAIVDISTKSINARTVYATGTNGSIHGTNIVTQSIGYGSLDPTDSSKHVLIVGDALTPAEFRGNVTGNVTGEVSTIDNHYLTVKGWIDSNVAIVVDSAYVQARVDSDYVKSIIDSAYVALVLDSGLSISGNLTVGGELNAGSLNLTNTGSTTFRSDNELILAATDRVLIDSSVFRLANMTDSQVSSVSLPENGDMVYNSTTNKFQGYENGAWVNLVLDSGSVVNIIDSAYIQARQVDIYRDSAFVTNIVNSSYINSLVSFDSATVTNLVDSAYIQLRDRFQDSSGILAIVDSAYVQARQDQGTDSATVVSLITTTVDSNYVNNLTNKVGASSVIAPFAYAVVASTSNGSATNLSWSNWNSGNASLDFAFTTAQPDANYTVVTDCEVFDDNFVQITNKTVNGFTASFYTDTADTLPSSFRKFTFIVYGSTPTRSVGGGVAAEIDSADVIQLIDSAYVNARVDTGTDSATVLALIDSAHVQLRQDYSWNSITDKPDFFDSNDATILIDSAYINARIDSATVVSNMGLLEDLKNVDLNGLTAESTLVYNGTKWVIDQRAFDALNVDAGTATFADEGLSDDGGTAQTTFSSRDRIDYGTAFSA